MIEKLENTAETVLFHDYSLFKIIKNYEYENFPPHWHTPVEIIMPVKNTYSVTALGHTYNLAENDILILLPCVLHSITAPKTGVRYITQFALEKTGSASMFTPIISHLPSVIHIDSSCGTLYSSLHAILSDIISTPASEPMYEIKTFGKIIHFLIVLSEYTKSSLTDVSENRKKEYSVIFSNVFNYINTNFSEQLTLEGVATYAGFSKYHFERLFKKMTNDTFYHYLNTVRVRNSEIMLANSDVGISEIAFACGYSTASSYTRMFKSLNSISPSEYRKMQIQ